jgi:NADPH:quinone reductase-like Zn-dependent oxidoreductase
MKAVRLYDYGGPETLRYEQDVPLPSVGPDTVLIEATATSVNPVDWKIRSGARQHMFKLDLPTILGKDVSGIVSAVGSAVRAFNPGDRVIAMADATYAQYVAAPEAWVTHLPEGIDLADAAAIPVVSLTGHQLVTLETRAMAGQTILVTGALGSVGRAALHTARKLGATVIAGVRNSQLSDAKALGAAAVLALDDDDAIARLDVIDGVADTVGGDLAAKLLAKVRPGGRFGYAAWLPDDIRIDPSIEVSRVYARPDPATLRDFAEDIRDGAFALPVSRHMPLHDAGAAHALLEKGGAGKIVLRIA